MQGEEGREGVGGVFLEAGYYGLLRVGWWGGVVGRRGGERGWARGNIRQ